MARRRIASLCVLWLALALAGCATGLRPAATPEALGFSSARLATMVAAIEEGIAKKEIPGAVVLLARRGQIAYWQAFGERDPSVGAPMQRDVIFQIASMTKPVTSAAVMVLVDDGRLSLDDPVSRHLPAFKDLMVGVEKKDPAGQPSLALEPAPREMTVLDLLRHTSGLTYGIFGRSLVKQRYNAARLFEPNLTNADLVARLAQLPLQNPPGAVWDYSMSTDVLGHLVEVVSGMDLDRFVAQRIFQPLGMVDSGFWLEDTAKLARLAATVVDPATARPAALPNKAVRSRPSGGGGMVSTAHDYARFCQMLLNGGELDGVRVLSRQSVERMTRDQLPPAVSTNSTRLAVIDVRPEAGHGFGLGVMVRTRQGLSPIRGNVGDYTWNGLLGTYFWVDPAQELVGIIMMQTPAPAFVRSTGYWVRIRNLAYEALVN